jgi:similar to stage IV sporulation protein
MRGIGFWDLRKEPGGAKLTIYLSSFNALHPLVRQTRCRLHIQYKAGLPFWAHRLRRRWGLVIGVFIFIASLYTATSIVWFLRVTGVKHLEEAEILQLAGELGICPGVWKRKLDLPELEEEMARRHGDIAWVGLRLRGILLEIEIAEHLPEPEVDDRPADLVAAKDGLVIRVLVLEGEAAVAPGATVSKGDILIRGIFTYRDSTLPPDQQPPPAGIRARGEVEARVWYEAREPVVLREVIQTDTGRSRRAYALRWPGGGLEFHGFRPIQFLYSRQEIRKWSWRWRNLSLPVELVIVTFCEVLLEEKTHSWDEALQRARDTALLKVRQQLPPGAPLEQLYFQEYDDEDGTWTRAVIETRENIAEIRLHGS